MSTVTGYQVVKLGMLIETIGEEKTRAILSDFVCPYNGDIEDFLRTKAVPFLRQGIAITQLVFASHKNILMLAGYFALAANRYLAVRDSCKLNARWRKRIQKFGTRNVGADGYVIPAPLIAQLSKNFALGCKGLISGEELLEIACQQVREAQGILGGKIVYLECENNPHLIDFYESNGFCEFDRRPIYGEEKNAVKSDCYIQYLKYLG